MILDSTPIASKARDRLVFIRHLSSGLPDAPLFWRGLSDGQVRSYTFYHGEELCYTGLTRNLLGQIQWHRRDRHRGKWNHFVIFRIHRVRYLKDIETLLLNLVEPPGNRVRGNVPRDGDLNRVLRSTLAEYRKRIRGYTKSLSA